MTIRKAVVVLADYLLRLKWKTGNEKAGQIISARICRSECGLRPPATECLCQWSRVRLKVLHSKSCESGLSNFIHSYSQVPCPRGIEPSKLMTEVKKQPSLHNRRRVHNGPVSSSTNTPAFLIMLGKHNTAILKLSTRTGHVVLCLPLLPLPVTLPDILHLL